MPQTAAIEAFIAALPERTRAPEELKAAFERALSEAEKAYPDLALDEVAFAEKLARVVGDAEDVACRASDLYLAFACANGDPRALAIFEREHLAHVPDFIARIDRDDWFADEVKQRLRERLFVAAPDSPARITEYRGDGALGGWVRVAAVRIALNMKRGEGRRREAALETLELAAERDPEVIHLRRLLGDDFRQALEATLLNLPSEERTVLRMHYLDGLSSEELAKLHRVHRATIARWLERARNDILEETRRRLRSRLGEKSSSEIDSIVRLVQSELDVSVARFLRTTAGA